MKKFLVVLLALVMVFGLATTALAADEQIPEFNDISGLSQAAQDAVQRLAVLGVLEGNEGLGGAYRPADNLTRAEFAKIAVLVSGKGNAKDADANKGYNSTKFPDNTAGNWYTGWVNIATENGFFKGDTAGNFRPNAEVTAQEVSTVLLRIVGYDDHIGGGGNGNYGVWPYSYNTKARAVGLLDDVDGYVGNAALNRGNMSIMLDNMLELNLVSYISNEFAAATALAGGYGDTDWFVEKDYRTNENDNQQGRDSSNILKEAFDAYAVHVLFDFGTANAFDETSAWQMDDLSDGEYSLNIVAEREDDNPEVWIAAASDLVNVEVASKYYITKGFNFPDLANMYAKVTVYDKTRDEVCFVQVKSSIEAAMKVYAESSSNSRINVDGKSAQISTHPFYEGVAGKPSNNFWELTKDLTNIRALSGSDKDNTFPAKVYLDAEGRIYAIRNTNVYDYIDYEKTEVNTDGVTVAATNRTPFYFGIFSQLDGNEPDYKADSAPDEDVDFKDDDIVYYKNGKFIALEDIEENDVIYYLGNGAGVEFFLVKAPEEGQFTKKTTTRFTVSGKDYLALPGAAYFSDDAGDRFSALTINTDLDTSVYGDATYVKAYNHSDVAYISSESGSTKLYGIVTEVNANYTYTPGTGGSSPNAKVSGVTVLNGEGKEVSYNFITDLKDDYNDNSSALGGQHGLPSGSKYLGNDARERAYNTPFITNNGGTFELFEGMLVRFTLNSSGDLRRIDDYVPMDMAAAVQTVDTYKDRQRINVPSALSGADYAKQTVTTGAIYLADDAIIFSVTPKENSTDFKSAKVQSISSLLSSDFKANQVFSFATVGNMSGADTTVLYVVQEGSTDELGLISSYESNSDGFQFKVDGTLQPGDDGWKATPAFVIYSIVDGEVNVSSSDVLVNKTNLYINNTTTSGRDLIERIADIVDNEAPIVIGLAKYSTRLTVDGTLFGYKSGGVTEETVTGVKLDTTSISYVYDLFSGGTSGKVVSARDLDGHYVVGILDKDNNAIYVIGITANLAAQAGLSVPVTVNTPANRSFGGVTAVTTLDATSYLPGSTVNATVTLGSTATFAAAGAPFRLTISSSSAGWSNTVNIVDAADFNATFSGTNRAYTTSFTMPSHNVSDLTVSLTALSQYTVAAPTPLTSPVATTTTFDKTAYFTGDTVTVTTTFGGAFSAPFRLTVASTALGINETVNITNATEFAAGVVAAGTMGSANVSDLTLSANSLYTIGTIAGVSVAVKGLTATAVVNSTETYFKAGDTVSVIVTLAGTATGSSTTTVGLAGTGITVTPPAKVTFIEPTDTVMTYTFTVTVPGGNINNGDLAVSLN